MMVFIFAFTLCDLHTTIGKRTWVDLVKALSSRTAIHAIALYQAHQDNLHHRSSYQVMKDEAHVDIT